MGLYVEDVGDHAADAWVELEAMLSKEDQQQRNKCTLEILKRQSLLRDLVCFRDGKR